MLIYRVILVSVCYLGECCFGFSRKERFKEREESSVFR